MKNVTRLTLTLVLIAAMAVTTANAQQYVHTDTLDVRSAGGIAFKDNETLIIGSGSLIKAWNVSTGTQLWAKGSVSDYGNNSSVYAVALPSHDPQFIAYSMQNRNIRMRYSDNGDLRGGVLRGHTDWVWTLAFKPNSYVLASGSVNNDDTVRIWNVGNKNDLRHVRTLRHTQSVLSVAWSPDGSTLASASADGTVRLWNPNNGINSAVLRGHTEGVNAVVWSPDGRTLASGSHDDTVRIWDADTHGTLRVLRGHTEPVSALAFHPNGQTLASGSYDDTIRLWHPNTGALKATLTRYHGGRSIAFSPNGQILAGRGPGPYDTSLWRWLTVDVTGNGAVNVNDLVEVARNYGKTVRAGANRRADVNNDGDVDFDDVLAVLKAVDAAAAPAIARGDIKTGSLQAADVQRWIHDAKAANVDPAGIAALERLLTSLSRRALPVPKKTVLLANYPNPFNPETWIPYQLSEAAEVTVTIHSSDGKLVRELELGQVPAGVYSDKDRAAYWDGRNAAGEPVASGVYFYTLQAGDFKATRKMVIRK